MQSLGKRSKRKFTLLLILLPRIKLNIIFINNIISIYSKRYPKDAKGLSILKYIINITKPPTKDIIIKKRVNNKFFII